MYRLSRLWEGVRAERGLVAACVACFAALACLRPADPFEWDEVLYQRALDHYDIAAHSPHPPGAPVYVALARLVRVVVRNPQAADQFVTIAFAVATLVLLFQLVRRLGGSTRDGILAAAVLAVVPGFAFHANVGLTDVPAAAGVVAVALACVAALEDPRRIVVVAASAAIALGVRPQVLPAVAALGCWATFAALRRGALRDVAKAVLVGASLTAAIWIPPIALTGLSRFRDAVAHHVRWMAVNEASLRLPAASWRSIARYWLVNQLGAPEIAAVFWALVLAGTLVLWLGGRRKMVAVLLLSAVPYFIAALFTFNMLQAVRYVLPTMAMVAPLAAASINAAGRVPRRVLTALLACWAVAALAWGAPVYLLRLQPAPVWSGLSWVRATLDARRVLVVSDGAARPHEEYVLGRAGFRSVDLLPGAIYPERGPAGEDLVLLTRFPVPGAQVLHESRWRLRRLVQLAFWRYETFTVQRPPAGSGARFSPAWQVEDDRFVLWGTGQVQLPPGSAAARATVCPLNAAVTVVSATEPPATVAAGACRAFALPAGPAGALFVRAPETMHAVLRPVVLEPSSLPAEELPVSAAGDGQAEHALLVAALSDPFAGGATAGAAAERARSAPAPVVPPQTAPVPTVAATATPVPTPPPALVLMPVARIAGHDGALWRTELVIDNPGANSVRVAIEPLLAGRDNGSPRRKELALAGGGRLTSEDALGDLFGIDGAGALRVRTEAPVAARLRTYDATRKAPRGHFLEARRETAGFGGGRAARLRGLANDPDPKSRKRTNLGVLNLTSAPIDVEITLADDAGTKLGALALRLGRWEFRQVNDVFAAAGAVKAATGAASVATATPGGSLLAYAAVVRREPAGVTYVMP